MKLYNELEEALETVITEMEEEENFKKRFKKLIQNFYDRSYSTADLEDTIALIDIEVEDQNAYEN